MAASVIRYSAADANEIENSSMERDMNERIKERSPRIDAAELKAVCNTWPNA